MFPVPTGPQAPPAGKNNLRPDYLNSPTAKVQISPYERVVLRSLEPACSQRTSTSPSPQYHDMIAGRPASVLSGGGDDATMYALGVLKWWRVALF